MKKTFKKNKIFKNFYSSAKKKYEFKKLKNLNMKIILGKNANHADHLLVY